MYCTTYKSQHEAERPQYPGGCGLLQPGLFSLLAALVHARDHGDQRQDECSEHHQSTHKLQKRRLLAKEYQPIEVDAVTQSCMQVNHSLHVHIARPSRSECLFPVSRDSIPNAGRSVGAKVSGTLKVCLSRAKAVPCTTETHTPVPLATVFLHVHRRNKNKKTLPETNIHFWMAQCII